MGVERTQIVPEERDFAGIDEPELVIDAGDPSLYDIITDWMTTLRTLGGMWSIAVRREKVGTDPFGDDVYVPRQYILKFDSFMPAIQPLELSAATNGHAEVSAEDQPEAVVE